MGGLEDGGEKAQRTYPQSRKDEVQRSGNLGYPHLAAFLSSDEDFLLYRRFSFLHNRILLNLQNDITRLECELEKLDLENPEYSYGDGLEDTSRARGALIAELRVKIVEYDESLTKFRELQVFQNPPGSTGRPTCFSSNDCSVFRYNNGRSLGERDKRFHKWVWRSVAKDGYVSGTNPPRFGAANRRHCTTPSFDSEWPRGQSNIGWVPRYLRKSSTFPLKPLSCIVAFVPIVKGHPVSTEEAVAGANWTQLALDSLTDIPLYLTYLLAPSIVTGVCGYMAHRFHKNDESGKAALGMLGMGAVFVTIRSPSSTSISTSDGSRFMQLAVAFGYVFFMVGYCRLVCTRNEGGKVFYVGAVALASLVTFALMGVPAVQAYWIQLVGLDPVFGLALSIPMAFVVCDVATYVADRLNGRG